MRGCGGGVPSGDTLEEVFTHRISSIAFRLPAVRRMVKRMEELDREQARVIDALRELETDRDELAAHCVRLDAELQQGHQREAGQTRLITQLVSARDRLAQERDELKRHCERMAQEFSEVEAELRQHHALVKRVAALERERNELRLRLMPKDELSGKMRAEWDSRAAENALYYTNTADSAWNLDEYFASGEANVREEISTDLANICQGADPVAMRVLEIGCGAGRMTRALARMFGEVHGVDISGEMLRQARQHLAGCPDVFLHQTNGLDLSVVPALPFDFAFSYIVFQHVPAKEVIENYIRDVGRLLMPGRLFKFQVQGYPAEGLEVADTWLGACFTVEEMHAIAGRHGFELRYHHGAGTQYFWLWFFKR